MQIGVQHRDSFELRLRVQVDPLLALKLSGAQEADLDARFGDRTGKAAKFPRFPSFVHNSCLAIVGTQRAGRRLKSVALIRYSPMGMSCHRRIRIHPWSETFALRRAD
jgi:hypothetical protein